MSDIFYGALAGDMAALNALFVLLLPFFVVISALAALREKIRRKR